MTVRKQLSRSLLLAISFFASLGVLAMTGCSMSTTAASGNIEGEGLQGIAHGGQNPIVGATVAIYTTAVINPATCTPAGSTICAYGGTVTQRATTTTGFGGGFNFSRSSYTCPTGSEAYLMAAGGNTGGGVGTNNTGNVLIAALGLCDNLTNGTFIVINEVTTVAAAYALGGFMPAGGAGMTYANIIGGTTMPGITTSTTNVQGLTDAFANAANIVNFATGAANPSSSTVTIPAATINALGNILQTCVNSADATTDSNCIGALTGTAPNATAGGLFTLATPAGTTISQPVNVLQVALNMAQYPANNIAGFLQNNSPAFNPALTGNPNDWTIGIAYTSSLLTSGVGLGIDSTDKVYVTGAGYLIDFSAQGAPLTTTNLAGSPITSGDSLRQIAFDPSGKLYMTDGAYTGVYQYNPTGGTITALNFDVAPTTETNNNTYGVASDQNGDIWTSSYSKATCSAVTCPLVEFPSSITTASTTYANSPPYASYTPFASFSGFTAPQPTNSYGGARGIAYDVNNNHIWITSISDNLAEVFTVAPGSGSGVATASASPTQITGLGTEVASPSTKSGCGTISVAVDSTDQAWFVTAGGSSSTCGSTTAASITPVSAAGAKGTALTLPGTPNGLGAIAIDGSNNLFVANANGSSVVAYSKANAIFLSPSAGLIPSSLGSSATSGLYQPTYLEVDKSGALWTLSSGNGTTHPATLIQILGVAAPTDPVLADGKYGVKP